MKRLKTELQANASSVETDLVAGDHGHLGMVLTDTEHATIPGTTPLVAPNYPGPLNTPTTSTPIEALNIKDAHGEEKRLHLECKNVEKSLMRHILGAVDENMLNR